MYLLRAFDDHGLVGGLNDRWSALLGLHMLSMQIHPRFRKGFESLGRVLLLLLLLLLHLQRMWVAMLQQTAGRVLLMMWRRWWQLAGGGQQHGCRTHRMLGHQQVGRWHSLLLMLLLLLLMRLLLWRHVIAQGYQARWRLTPTREVPQSRMHSRMHVLRQLLVGFSGVRFGMVFI